MDGICCLDVLLRHTLRVKSEVKRGELVYLDLAYACLVFHRESPFWNAQELIIL